MRYIIAGSLILISGIAVGQEKELFPHRGDWSTGFESLRIGMPAEELWSRRPGANLSPIDAPHETGEGAEVRGTPHQEVLRNTPVEGVDLLVKYDIVDEKLDTILMLWIGDSETMRGLRKSFVGFCVENFGASFQPDVVEQYPKDARRHVAPLLCWDIGQQSISASCTPDLVGTDLKKASFSLLIEPNREDSTRRKTLRRNAEKGYARDESRRRAFESAGISLPSGTEE